MFPAIFLIVFLSCNLSAPKTTNKAENAKKEAFSADTALKSKPQPATVISDTVKRFVVDDYPITNVMLDDKTSGNPTRKIQSGSIYSDEKVWFTNDTLNQTIVFELYTDHYRGITYHFYNNDVTADLIDRIELYENGEPATIKQKLKNFNGFLSQATRIDSRYFATNKGFRLGDTKQKATKTYGNPHKKSMHNGVEKLEWDFVNIPLVHSFGHHIVMYFKKGRLIRLILYNDVP
ncbi:hypothetical protein SAMN05216311_112215 [Chitinophaga sp. CF418]|nr:hypothetical protein SAMN05216311_112215 [Chitinophaga sp. CF418]